ncbi:MAG TPA: hypothetical protein VIF62_14600 [Labilithrix sp.]
MAIVPASSVPLFTFASDGTMAWLRTSGPRLLAVDSTTGQVLREVRLDPAPYGLTWHVERHGGIFVVRDDREIAAYEEASGARLWKRTSPTKVAIVGETEDGKHVSVAPGPDGTIDVLETDLRLGTFDMRARVQGTMRWIGANGVLTDDMLVFATDQRDVYAVDRSWRVVQRLALFGSHVLPPIATTSGVHVAVVEQRTNGAVTKVTTLDRKTADVLSTHEMPGEAYAIAPGASGLLLDVRRSTTDAPERVAFRPESPHLRLIAPRHVDLGIVPDLAMLTGSERPVEILAPEPERERRSREELVPPAREGHAIREASPRDGLRGLLALLEARSTVLERIANAFEDDSNAIALLARIGLVVRDPRVRWNARAGRDPCLLDIAEDGAGDTIATYLYPPGANGRVVVVAEPRGGGAATWLSDDFDAWFGGFLDDARERVPDFVRLVLEALGLDASFPREQPTAIPPRWFFEAHGAAFTVADAEAALAAGDVEGAERMLVSAAMRGSANEARTKLAAIYDQLGWAHPRAKVLETW